MSEEKTRKTRKKSPLVVGTWSEDRLVFTALDTQSDEPITSIGEMAAWVRENYKDQSGRYEFVAARPEQLTTATQTVMKAVLE